MENEKSEFNVAFSYLNTINLLQSLAAEAALEMNITYWRSLLGTIFRRVAPYMSEKEFPKYNTQFLDLSNEINNYEKKIGKGSFKQGIPTELFNKLHDFEIAILRFAKNAELISKSRDEAGEALR